MFLIAETMGGLETDEGRLQFRYEGYDLYDSPFLRVDNVKL